METPAPFSSEFCPEIKRGLDREPSQPGDGAACLLSMVQAGDKGEKAWALSRALLFDEADVTAFLCHNCCVFAKKQKGSQICGLGLGHGAFHFLQGLSKKILLYLLGINSANPQPDHRFPMLEFKRCLPFSFFCLGQLISWDRAASTAGPDASEGYTGLAWSLQESDSPSLPAAAAG